MKKRTMIAARIAALLLVLCLSVGLEACKKKSTAPLSPGLSMIEGVPVHDDNVAMQTDHFTVTPGMMAYFFYDYGGVLLGTMEKNKPYDATKSLHDQMYTETESWYDVIMNETLRSLSQILIYCEAAHAAGVTLTDAQKRAVDSEITDLRFDAAAGHSMELEPYLQKLYGPLITEGDLRAALELRALASAHAATVNSGLENAITEGQILDYAAANGLTDGTRSRNITYLLLTSGTSAATKQKAESLMQTLLNSPTDATMQSFSGEGTVAREANLTPTNSGVSAIARWLFATGRKVGDAGRVDTNGVIYLLLYTGDGMTYGEVAARMALYDNAFANWYNGWVDTLTFGYNYDILDGYDIDP